MSGLRVLLVDLDNCPQELSVVDESSLRYDRIILGHGSVEPKIPISNAEKFVELTRSGRVEVLPMAKGKNAADFGLTFLAGRLSATLPDDTIYHVVSKDSDLDHVVGLLRGLGLTSRRLPCSCPGVALTSNQRAEAVAGLPGPRETLTLSLVAADMAQCLMRHPTCLPKRKQTLLTFSRSHLGVTIEVVEEALAELQRAGVVTLSDGNEVPQYDFSVLDAIA